MHLLTRLLVPEPPTPKPPSRPASPSLAPLAPTRHASPTVRSRKSPSPTAKDKKENKKEKEGKSRHLLNPQLDAIGAFFVGSGKMSKNKIANRISSAAYHSG